MTDEKLLQIKFMQWYIPEPRTHHDSNNAQRLVYILQELGVNVYCHPYERGMDYSFLDPSRPVVLYGNLNAIKDAQNRKISFSPFYWCDFDELKCSNYYAWWGKDLVQCVYAFYPLDEVARNRHFIYRTFGRDNKLFIRPDDNMKTFTGEVVEWERFDAWWKHCRDYEAGPNCPCVVSRPEPIEKEWRFIIHDGKVVTGSQYKDGNHLDVKPYFPAIALQAAENIATSCDWVPHPIYVMDIALTGDEYRLLEIGSVNAAGLYACDLRAFVEAVNKEACNGSR